MLRWHFCLFSTFKCWDTFPFVLWMCSNVLVISIEKFTHPVASCFPGTVKRGCSVCCEMWCLILRLCNLRLPQHFTELQTWILDNLIWQWRLYCKKTSIDSRSMEIDVLMNWCLIWPLDDLTLTPNLETLPSKLDMRLQSKGPDFKDLKNWLDIETGLPTDLTTPETKLPKTWTWTLQPKTSEWVWTRQNVTGYI